VLRIVELCFDRDVVLAPSIMVAWEASEQPVNAERHSGPPLRRYGIAPFAMCGIARIFAHPDFRSWLRVLKNS
jgi:hypothetical protein